MNVSKRLKVDFVQFRKGEVLINVTPQLVDESGKVVGTEPTVNIHSTQDKLLARAMERGVSTWDDPDIESEIRADAITESHEEPIPEKEREEAGYTVRMVTTSTPRFEPGIAIVW